MLDPQARTARPDPLVKTAPPDPTVVPARLETRDRPDPLAHPATTELLATRDHPDRMDPRENRVFAPSIAPPTVVSSSRMEQGDKLPTSNNICIHRFCYFFYFADEKPVIIFMSIMVFNFFNSLFQPPHLLNNKINTAAAIPVISFGAF
jgi:hypothetical protein